MDHRCRECFILGHELGWQKNYQTQPTDVSLIVKDALPIRNDIRQWIPPQLQRHIEGVELCSLWDKMVFAPSEIGNFSAKLFAAQIRKTGTRRI